MNKIITLLKCLAPALLLMLSACGEKGTMIHLGEATVLYQKPGEDKFALYSHRGENPVPDESERCSQAVFESTFETLNLADVKDSQNMFILTSDGKKYLFHYTTPMLGGQPFSSYHKDEAGGVYFQTAEGKWLIAGTDGLPAPVDDYLRTGGDRDVFLFKQEGKWGVCRRFVKSGTNVFRDPEYQYVRLLPAECQRVRYVCGDGADHFLVQVAGKWRIVDTYGRDRQMCQGYYDKSLQLNIYGTSGTEGGPVTATYIRQVLSILVGCTGRYVPYLRTKCTYTGNNEAGIIWLETHEDAYQRTFGPSGDRSSFNLPWDEVDYHDLYHL